MGHGSGHRPLGEILVEDYRVAPEDVSSAVSAQRFSTERIGRLLVRMGVLSERDLVTALGQQLRIPVVLGLARLTIPDDVLMLVPMRMAERKLVIPVEIFEEGPRRHLVLAMADPTDRSAVEALEGLVGLSVMRAIAAEEDVRRALKVFYFNEPIHRDPDEITGTFERLRKRLHEASVPSGRVARPAEDGSVPQHPVETQTTAH